ncbi:LysR family transcriptional regulator [Burkholderia ubonensis]|uniref:LysR family transcriptional regulator n=1 Tax=Burkholderia ubonensis TaxID=101571 RepID=UPI0009B3F4B7|nr:LysR family transcriptional regulator [Burkholderia ubonensis]
MNYRDLDLNLLVALQALLETRSVSRAAEMLHIGQPACSSALARLRAHFGDDLLVPTNRRMVPTPLALQLEHPAREAIKRAEAISAMRAGFVPSTAVRRFSIICSDMVTKLVLTHVIRELELGAPNVSLMIHSAAPLRSSRMLVEEALDRRGADFVVVPARYVPGGYTSLPLLSTDYSCIVWKGNSLVQGSITRDLFYSLKHIVPTFGDGQVTSLDDEDALLRLMFSAKSEYALALPSLIRGTDHIATVPTLLAWAYETQYDIRVFPVPISVPRLDERLVWPKHLDDDQASIWLRNLIHRCAPSNI